MRGNSAFAVALLLFVPSVAAQKTPEQAIVWESKNNTYDELTREFANLYGSLVALRAKGATIPTAMVTVPAGKTVADVLRERGLYDGKYVPKQLDVLVCGLNPGVCTVQLGKSRNPAAADATAIWRIQSNDSIAVPEIAFTPITVYKPYDKRSGDTLKSIVVDDRRGCESFDEACQKKIQNLNRRLPEPLDTAFAGRIVVPTKAYRAAITISTKDGAEKTSSGPIEPAAASSPGVVKASAGHEMSKEVVKMAPTLKDQVVPSAKASLHQDPAVAPTEGSRAVILKLIRHPLATATSIAIPASATNVTVFDSWVDKGHCMLKDVKVLDPDGLAGTVERSTTCGDRGDARAAQDHGTHVVGLIGMRVDGKYGPGINPYATIRALSINPDNFKSPGYLAKQSDRLRELYNVDPPDVVNLSFEYSLSAEEGRNDVFHVAMKEQEHGTLFIASAGNDGTALNSTGECRVRPACYDDMNIVTVGAVDLNEEAPSLLSNMGRGSNYGDRVHIVAPGQNIVSSISGDRLGVMSGTSQAAPAVAGAASLLYHYEPKILPSQVKNRLIYTSDLFPSLYDKVRGGRLNVQRLLAYKSALVDLDDGQHLEGTVRDPVGTSLRFTDFNTNEVVRLWFGQIRRLKLNRDLGYYTIFYNDDVGRDSGPMKRRFVTLKDVNAKASFGIPTAAGPEQLRSVKVKDIIDYVSPLLL